MQLGLSGPFKSPPPTQPQPLPRAGNLLPDTGATNTIQRPAERCGWMDVYIRFQVQSPSQGPSFKKYSWVNPRHSPPEESSLMHLLLDLKEKMHTFSFSCNCINTYLSLFMLCFVCQTTETKRSLTPHPTGGLSRQQLGCLFPIT